MTHGTPPKRVAIYARFSSDMQSPKSIEDQVRECRMHAQREGWTVVQVFSDVAISGATKGRPDFDALQAAVRAGQFDIVLFEHLDRLGRDLEFLMAFYKLAHYEDTELHQLRRGKLGIFDIGILGTFAQIFLEELGHKTRRGLAGRIEAGKSAGGLSYGYKVRRIENGEPVKGEIDIDPEEAAIVTRIFEEYAAGKSPLAIARDLNAEGIPAPAKDTKRLTSGHWKQNTIYGHRGRGTGILNNELYIGRRIWNRLRYSKHPETGKRVSRLNPPDEWTIIEKPDLRILPDELWERAKARQESVDAARAKAERGGRSGAGAAQGARRRKYLLSGLLTCGQCGGNLTVAGKGDKRRYYCANAKEKGDAVCSGMPGLKETAAADILLSGLRAGLMQDDAYARFAAQFEAKMKAGQKGAAELLKAHDLKTRELEQRHRGFLDAVAKGDHSPPIIKALNAVDAELEALRAERDTLVPAPVELPPDLPELYREYVANLAATLQDEAVSAAASDELHGLIDTVVVVWDAEANGHRLDVQGKLLEMLAKAKPAEEAGLVANGHSLKLVAGVGFEPTTFRL
ncbi:MAG: recombinase family protein [Alphaproteobacteria bacterium HGW-Alphaproteobacteria-1]|nr:MAG: recombinase family protein [Alphaproteobacteria bacterium HGW-Alphaproteobacteria-1]